MDLLTLSKFKFQLQALITEIRELRERERLAVENVQRLTQNGKQVQNECSGKLRDLQEELDSSNDQREKLERQVVYLESENAVLNDRQKELQATIHNILQSRKDFIDAYKESNSGMKEACEKNARRLVSLSDKLKLLESVRKEAASVKIIHERIQCSLSSKEQVGVELKDKMVKILGFETLFVEKIRELERERRNAVEEVSKKEETILHLRNQLEAVKISSDFQPKLVYYQKTITEKDKFIQSLTSEKKTLLCEVSRLGTILEKIQATVEVMNYEEQRSFSEILDDGKQNSVNDDRDDVAGIGGVMVEKKAAGHDLL